MSADDFRALFGNSRVGRFTAAASLGASQQQMPSGWDLIDSQGFIADGVIRAAQVAVGGLSADNMSSDFRNTLPYPGGEYFDDGLTTDLTSLQGWTIATGGSIRRDGFHQRSGTGVFQYVAPSTTAASAFQTTVAAQGNHRYKAGAWLAGYSGNTGNPAVQVVVDWFDSNDTLISQVTTGVLVLGTSESFTEHTDVFVSPADTVKAKFILFVSGQDASDRFYADDCELRIVDEDVNHAAGNVLIDSTGITINNGKLTFRDQFGANAIDGGGFGAAWRRFITSGLYNSDFAATAATVGSDIGSSNPLPSWTFVQASGTAIKARSIADANSASGYVLRFTAGAGGAANDSSYIEQIVPVNGTRNQVWSYLAAAGFRLDTGWPNTDFHLFIRQVYLTADGSVIGSEAELKTAIFGSTNDQAELPIASVFPYNESVPSNAAFLRIRVGMGREAGAPTGSTCAVDLTEVYLSVGQPRVTIADWNDPQGLAPARLYQLDGVLNIVPAAGDDGLDTQATQFHGVQRYGGTAFPDVFATGDQFYRTDLDTWFRYDGTRWKSVNLMYHQFHKRDDGGGSPTGDFFAAASATGVSARTDIPLPTGFSDAWIEEILVGFTVAGGGSALSGSHKWNVAVARHGSGTSVGNVDISSGASGTFRRTKISVDALTGSSDTMLQLSLTKTGTPGNLSASYTVVYRLVAT